MGSHFFQRCGEGEINLPGWPSPTDSDVKRNVSEDACPLLASIISCKVSFPGIFGYSDCVKINTLPDTNYK